jgi:hypothetical protein
MDWRDKPRTYKVYAIEDGKGGVYVGSTSNSLAHRLKQQKNNAIRVGNTMPLFKAINDGNASDFKIRQLDTIRGTYTQVRALEDKWKKKLNATLNGLIPGSEASIKFNGS